MTTAELNDLWMKRDSNYAMRKALRGGPSVSDEEATIIRFWRRTEIDNLPPDERSAAWGIWTRWSPPLIIRR